VSVGSAVADHEAWDPGLHDVELHHLSAGGGVDAVYFGQVWLARSLSQLEALGGGDTAGIVGAGGVQVFADGGEVRVVRGESAGAAGAAQASAAAAEAAAVSAAADAVATAADRGATHTDKLAAEADAVATAADRAATHADKLAADADAVATAADRVQTGLDAVATAADRAAVHTDKLAADADAVATAADRVQTGLDAAATAADRTATHADKLAADADAVATAADRVQTGLDAAATAADRTATHADKLAADADAVATAADRVQTGLDAAATAADRTATHADKLAADADAVATAADRVQTGQDRTAAQTAKTAAEAARDATLAASHMVSYDAQTLTTPQQAQARTNIDAPDTASVTAKVAKAGDTMTGTLLATDGVPDLGDATHRFRDLNLSRNVTLGGALQLGTAKVEGATLLGIGNGLRLSTVGSAYLMLSATNLAFSNDGGTRNAWYQANASFAFSSPTVIGWTSSATNAATGLDTAFSRASAGVAALGTGAAGNAGASLQLKDLIASGAVVHGSFTVATVPAAASYARGVIWVSNESGGACLAYSDGTNWRRVRDGVVIS
jgi:hypothetical protein